MSKQRISADWNDFPLILAIAREGRLSAASLSLGIDGSTVGRRLTAAEERLGARLFVRDLDGYRPTSVGDAVIAVAEEIERKVLALYQTARQTAAEISGPVRITSVDALLTEWLTPRLPVLLETYPGLEIRLIAENRNLSFSRGETDLALRLAQPRGDAAIRMRRVGRLGVAIYGHAKFRDVSPDEWKSQPWLFYNDDVMDASSLRWLHSLSLQVAPRLRSSSTSILVKACKAGLGIALLPCVVADDTDLVRLSPSNVVEGDIWLLSHRDTSDIQRFRVVTDWLARQVALDKDILLGTVHD